ncbi:MAG: protein kinase [Bacteroidia bacterium]|nr:protein kinase [Bacteroidia bacterium]
MNLPKEITHRFQFDPKTDRIGIGGTAFVYKAKDTQLDRIVAIKTLSPVKKGHPQDFLQEIRRAIKLDHPNILRYFDIKEWEEENEEGEKSIQRAVVLEYANEGDLAQFIRRNPPLADKQKIVADLLQGVKYMHTQKVVHFDLKPENIFLVEKDGIITAKIADFGLSTSLDNPSEGTPYTEGSLHYMAPERLNPGKFLSVNHAHPSMEADIWALGAIIYFIFTGQAPFAKTGDRFTSNDVIAYKITEEPLPQDVETIPDPYQVIVRRCMIKDPARRPINVDMLVKIIKDHGLDQTRKLEAKKQAQNVPPVVAPVTPPPSPKPEPKSEPKPEAKKAPQPAAREKDWKLKVPCPSCGTENKVDRLRCSNCDSVLKGPAFVRHFKPAGALGLTIFMGLFTVEMVWPFMHVFQKCNWNGGDCNLTSLWDISSHNKAETIYWIVSIFSLITWLITAALFSRWVNRAHGNLDSLNAKKLNFAHGIGGILFALPLITPLACVGISLFFEKPEILWLAPAFQLLSLLIPYFFMKEIWKGSHPELIDQSGLGWKKGKSSNMLTIWWGISLLFPLSFLIPIFLSKIKLSDTEIIISQAPMAVSIGLMLAASTLTILVIWRINFRQKKRFKNIILAWQNQQNS